MDLGWRKVPTLLILLIFWKHAVGQQGWSSYDVQPHQKWSIHKVPSRWGAQSSVLEAPVSGSIPLEEVASNVLSGKGLNASRSRFSLSHQSVKGGISGSYGSVSHTQSAPSTSVSASLALPQIQHSSESNAPLLRLAGSFVPSIQDLASQSTLQETSSPLSSQNDSSTRSPASSVSEFTYTSQGNSRPQLPGSSSQLVSTHVSGLLLQSPSIANATGSSEYTEAATSPLGVSQSTSGQSSYSQYTSGSQSRVGTQLAVSSHVPTLGSSHGSFQTPGTTSQYAPASYFAAKMPVSRQSYPASLSGSSLYPSQSSQKWQPSASRTKVFQPSSTALSQGFQTSDASQRVSQSHRISSLSTASDGSSRQIQGTSSQYGPATLDAKLPVYSQAAPSGSLLSLSQPSLSRWSQGFQTSGTVPSQGFQTSSTSQSIAQSPSRISSLATTSTGGSSLQIHGTSIQSASATLDAQLPVYSHAAPSGSSLSLSQPTQLKPSVSRWSQGFQTSVTVTSQSGSPSEGSKAPSRFSTLISAASPGQFSPTQDGRVKYSGLPSQSQSASSQYRPSSPVYAKHGSLLNPPTPSTSDRGTLGLYASSSHSRTALAGSSRYGPTQTGNTFTDGSSRKLQVATSQYAPATLNVKLPVYSQAAPSGSSSSLSQPSQLKPSPSKWSQGFQASSTVASQGFQKLAAVSQSSSSSEGSKATSRFSTLISAASPGQFSPTQDGRVKYSGLPSQSQSASSQYRPSSSVYAKHGSLLNPSTPSTSDQGTLGSYASSSHTRIGTQLAGSSHYVSTQTGSTFTDGSSLKLEGTSNQYTPATLDAKLPVSRQSYPASLSGSSLYPSQSSQKWQPSASWAKVFQVSSTALSQGLQTSDASQRTAPSPSRISSLTTASTDGPSLKIQDTSGQYAPATLDAKLPVYSQAAPSGSLSLSQASQVKPSISGWSQGFQTSVTATSQSGSPSEGSKAPSRFPTLISATSPGQFSPTRDGSGKYSGLSSQSQSASSQYMPGSPVYTKHGSLPTDPSSQSTRDHSPSGLYTSISHSRIGTQLAGSSRYVSTQKGSTSSGGSLQLEGTTSQYAPATAKLPVYSQAAPSGSSLSLSQPSKLKPSLSRWSQGFQTSGTVPSQGFQTSGASQSIAQSPSRVSSLATASTDGPSLQIQGTSSQSAPATLGAKLPVYSEAAPSGSSLSQKWQPSASRWSQWFQASGTSVSQSSSSPQTSQLSSGSPFMPALSPPVDSAVQSRPNSISSSSRISSLSAARLQPSEAASGFIMPRKVFPGLFASIQHPTDSMTASVGSNVQAASQGIFSGHSSDSTSVPPSSYASYGQKPSSHSSPSLSSSASRQYSSVKG